MFRKLQLIETSNYSYITLLLKQLHWHPASFKVHFKILVFAFRAVHGQAPVDISELLHLDIS